MADDNPFDFFDKICCINLPQSTRRKNVVSEQFTKLNILDRVEWVYAPPPPDDFNIDLYRRNPAREFGCNLSHLTALVQAVAEHCDTVLIFEDDITATTTATEILRESLQELPDDWIGLYLGAGLINNGVTSVSKHLGRFNYNALAGGYAYAFNCKHFMEFFKFWTYGVTHGLTPSKLSPMDVILPHFMGKRGGGYVIQPSIIHTPIGGPNSIISPTG